MLTLLASFMLVAPTHAQDASTSASKGIQISPALVELNASPGKTYNIKLNITNVTSSDLIYDSSVDDFGADGETGSPKILADGNLPATSSVKTWVSMPASFKLAGKASREVTARVSIPVDAEPGGHYGVLRFSSNSPDLDGNGVGLLASAGALMLVRVDGDINEKAELASYFTASADGKQKSVFESSPINFVVRIKNSGNIHVKPVGNIEIRDLFGGLVATLPINEKDKSNVLPDSIRKFDSAKYDKPWMFGKYTANLTLGYGTTGQAIVSSIDFWVIPYKAIIGGLLVIIIIVYVSLRLIKRYNRYIITKSKNAQKSKNHKRSKR